MMSVLCFPYAITSARYHVRSVEVCHAAPPLPGTIWLCREKAYVCAAGKWDSVVDGEAHLFPFVFREHLNNPDGLVKSLESVGIDTTSFRINILNSLWVNP